jgi:hypothetical protein
MSAFEIPLLSQLARNVRTGVVAFFQHDVALKRADDGVHIVLKERPPKPAPCGKEEMTETREKVELHTMRCELAALLNELPETRQTMRHLVFVEQALARKGLRALHKLPLDLLQRALDQLEGLVTNWSPAGLANLRSKMAVAIIDREHMDPEVEPDAYRTALVLDSTPPPLPEHDAAPSDDDALAAAYAALGSLAPGQPVSANPADSPDTDPGAIQFQGELGSPAARALHRQAQRPAARAAIAPDSLQLRELQS